MLLNICCQKSGVLNGKYFIGVFALKNAGFKAFMKLTPGITHFQQNTNYGTQMYTGTEFDERENNESMCFKLY